MYRKTSATLSAHAVERGDVDDYYIIASLRKTEGSMGWLGLLTLANVLLRECPSYKNSTVLMQK